MRRYPRRQDYESYDDYVDAVSRYDDYLDELIKKGKLIRKAKDKR